VDPAPDDALIRHDLVTAALAEARAWKMARYFHDCLPGCTPGSLDPADHVPLKADQGPTCRVLYLKALRWIRAGAAYPERGFIAANRIGKTDTAAYEVTCHGLARGRRHDADHARHFAEGAARRA
jgi:hypothetical protein